MKRKATKFMALAISTVLVISLTPAETATVGK